MTRKARKGMERARKLGYLLLAPATANPPMAVPMTPPMVPPLTVALVYGQLSAWYSISPTHL